MMALHGIFCILLALALGVAVAYVSPDDQGRSKSGDRLRFEQSRPAQRQRPQPLSAQDQLQLEQARLNQGPGARPATRYSRDVDTGTGYATGGSTSYAGSSAGAGGAAFGFPGFQGNPFLQNAGNQPFDFNGFFQQLQQIQQSIGQYALNHAQSLNGASGNFGSSVSSVSSGSFGNIALDELPANLPAFITLKNGTEIPIAVLLAAVSASRPASSQHMHGESGFGQGLSNQLGSNFEGASASASLGPNGGYGSAQLIPDLGNRFGGQGSEGGQSGHFGPPSGGNVGVFTSSSAGSSDVNGHRQSFKTATSGVNDNGKITTFTVRDPPQ